MQHMWWHCRAWKNNESKLLELEMIWEISKIISYKSEYVYNLLLHVIYQAMYIIENIFVAKLAGLPSLVVYCRTYSSAV